MSVNCATCVCLEYVFSILQLESEKSIKNTTEWALDQYYANYSSYFNTTDVPPPDVHPADVIRGPCWETAVGIVSSGTILNNVVKDCQQRADIVFAVEYFAWLHHHDVCISLLCRMSLFLVASRNL